MTHTPGPWAYDADSKEVFASTEHHSCGWIALVKGNDSCDKPLAAEMQAANARLIAAAPELLAQLKMAADFISGHNECLSEPSGSGDREWHAYCIGLLDDCKSAIAKAEGRTE